LPFSTVKLFYCGGNWWERTADNNLNCGKPLAKFQNDKKMVPRCQPGKYI
jgi:hypothetical protein